nr:TSUP family transporter [Pseudogemmobacter bohemicus]
MVYAAVGQAGASGYIAIIGVAGFEPLAMKTTALSLNLLVASIGTALFLRNGRLSWHNVSPFANLAFPFSMLGGAIHLPGALYFPLVGAVLILSALQMARSAFLASTSRPDTPIKPPFMAALMTDAVIGFVSGTTGTGGGVFLAPSFLA